MKTHVSARRRGASLTSYGLVVGLIAILAIGAVASVGDEISGLFGGVGDELDAVATSSGGGDGGAGGDETGDNGPPDCATITQGNIAGNIGELCDFNGTEVIVAGLTKDGTDEASSPDTPFFAARCDLGQSYNSSTSRCECDADSLVEIGDSINTSSDDPNNGSCDATDGSGTNTWHDRSNYPWNDGTLNWLDTPLDNVSDASGTNATSSQNWDAAWDGQTNADFLINDPGGSADTPGDEPFEAAEACAALGSGWYLPAQQELDELYANRNTGEFTGSFDATGNMPHGRYSSSSEEDNNSAWDQRFSDGDQHGRGKSIGLSVRCVRR